MRKVSIIISVVVCLIISVVFLMKKDNELNLLIDKINTLEKELEVKSSRISKLEIDLIDADNVLAELEVIYNKYAVEESNEFTSYMLDNPIDKAYLNDYDATLKGEDIGYYNMYYLEASYKRLWEIEMAYAYNRLYEYVEKDTWDYLVKSQDNFNKSIKNMDRFIYEAFTKNEIKIADSTTKMRYSKEIYKNRAIELLEYLYLLEDSKEPRFLFQIYSGDETSIESSELNLKEIFWDELEIVMPIEHRLTTLTPNGIHIFKLNGYKVIPVNRNYMSKFSINSIEIYDANYKLIQSIEVSDTLIPSDRLFDYGFKIVDWNFDGFPDISLFAYEGGTMLNAPTYFWLWDDTEGKYLINEQLTEYSQTSYLSVDINNEKVRSTYRAQGHHSTYYHWRDGDLIPGWYEGHFWERDENNDIIGYFVREVMENGEWVEVERTPLDDY
ncbi:hypothetical protein EDC19_0470 [Natranaerovirga hydrolytica]|uniref:Uncharacterized protein n=1 Tax=Natranaerovirga hydrolytica TaxID=680378 RepID=A0A4R1N230_9FIRM|nr:hypothetical protein [Natranaerovirga hydrolytica]TCK98054.1 hypothetical protein EDC19_0470 [Natranaerovirga hydrolytica]